MCEWEVVESVKTKSIYTTCPYCSNEVTFLPIEAESKDAYLDFGMCTNHYHESKYMGLRKCSHPECGNIIAFSFYFIADPIDYDNEGEIEFSSRIKDLQTLPAIDNCIQLENLPKNVRNSFIEVQKCFYNACFMASAVMIRKTLEEICADKGIKGKNIEIKIDNLLNSGKIPKDIGEELHELRKLGNDGAHIDLKTFNSIGKAEVKSALDVLTHVLEKIYCPEPDRYKKAVEKLRSHKKRCE